MKVSAATLFIAVVGAFVGFVQTPFTSGNLVANRVVSIAPVRYRLDPTRSTFMVHADRAGLAWFKGHSHRIAAKDFSGEVSLSLAASDPASLELTVKAASLQETDPVFTRQQKEIINKEINELVLETAKCGSASPTIKHNCFV